MFYFKFPLSLLHSVAKMCTIGTITGSSNKKKWRNSPHLFLTADNLMSTLVFVVMRRCWRRFYQKLSAFLVEFISANNFLNHFTSCFVFFSPIPFRLASDVQFFDCIKFWCRLFSFFFFVSFFSFSFFLFFYLTILCKLKFNCTLEINLQTRNKKN